MSGYVAVWTCHCSDAGYDPTEFPERCPEHDRRQAAITDLADEGITGPVATGHRCGPTDIHQTTEAKEAER